MEQKNLIYIVAVDPPESSGSRTLAKLLVSSLLRTFFSGDILVFRNTEAPLFFVERKGLEEVFIETEHFGSAEDRAEDAWCWKYRVRQLIDPAGYDKVVFLDADSLALRNIDHLFEGDWDIGFQAEPGMAARLPQFSCFLTGEDHAANPRLDGFNSGTLPVRGSRFHEVMDEWARIDEGEPPRERFCSDQGSWNKLLLDTGLKKVAFERDEVQFPLYLTPKYQDYTQAALVHNLGGNLVQKIQFTFGLYASTFYCDSSALLLDFMEV